MASTECLHLSECFFVIVISSSPSKKLKKTKTKTETTAGSGAGYKSKEFISDNEASSSDSDDKPLKRKETTKESDSEVGEVEILKYYHLVHYSTEPSLYV